MQSLLQWKNNNYYIFSLYVCRLRYSGWNVHAPYFHLWPARLYSLPHREHNVLTFKDQSVNILGKMIKRPFSLCTVRRRYMFCTQGTESRVQPVREHRDF